MVGQVDVVEFEVPDGAVACDVVGSQGDDGLNFVAFVGKELICRMSDKSLFVACRERANLSHVGQELICRMSDKS